jgi:hypothetical protein
VVIRELIRRTLKDRNRNLKLSMVPIIFRKSVRTLRIVEVISVKFMALVEALFVGSDVENWVGARLAYKDRHFLCGVTQGR